MRHFSVMSRSNAKRYTFGEVPPKTVIISIIDVESFRVNFRMHPNIEGICRVSFDDVERGEQNCITKEDARKIADFVEAHRDAENWIVHCEAGVSRSAGCCAAIEKYLLGYDVEIFDNPRFTPNMTVYREVLNTLFGEETYTFGQGLC